MRTPVDRAEPTPFSGALDDDPVARDARQLRDEVANRPETDDRDRIARPSHREPQLDGAYLGKARGTGATKSRFNSSGSDTQTCSPRLKTCNRLMRSVQQNALAGTRPLVTSSRLRRVKKPMPVEGDAVRIDARPLEQHLPVTAFSDPEQPPRRGHIEASIYLRAGVGKPQAPIGTEREVVRALEVRPLT